MPLGAVPTGFTPASCVKSTVTIGKAVVVSVVVSVVVVVVVVCVVVSVVVSVVTELTSKVKELIFDVPLLVTE